MLYLLDSNIFIQAKNFHYGMDFCPAFWDWLVREQSAGNIATITGVADELKGHGDELSQWIKDRDKSFFLPVDDEKTQTAFAQIADYVAGRYQPKNFGPFLSVADPWLIAKAMTTGATLVTHENLVPANSNKVKIPNICQQFQVSYTDCYSLLRKRSAKFVMS